MTCTPPSLPRISGDRFTSFVFVFDDLERVEPNALGEVMGLVNSLISEHGRRVIRKHPPKAAAVLY
jgi:hypothetical protein